MVNPIPDIRHGSFKTFFSRELRPLLEGMEKVRRKRIALYCVAILLILVFAAHPFRPGANFLTAAFLVFCAATIAWFLRGMDMGIFLPHRMRTELYTTVIPRCVDYAKPGMEFSRGRHIRSSVFLLSGLFTPRFNVYSGRSMFRGTGNGYRLRFSWLDVRYLSGKTEETVNVHDRRSRQIFKGWFFVATFPKNFNGGTMVLPDRAEASFGWFGRGIQEAIVPSGMELLLLEDAEFERHYKVLSTGQLDARHVLTPAFMDCASGVASRLRGRLCMSFLNSCMYVAVPVLNDFFDNMLMTRLVRPEPLRELFYTVRGVDAMAACLAANTTVWRENTGLPAIPFETVDG